MDMIFQAMRNDMTIYPVTYQEGMPRVASAGIASRNLDSSCFYFVCYAPTKSVVLRQTHTEDVELGVKASEL